MKWIYDCFEPHRSELGWNEETMLMHALGYIQNLESGRVPEEDFEAYLRRVADEEHGLWDEDP